MPEPTGTGDGNGNGAGTTGAGAGATTPPATTTTTTDPKGGQGGTTTQQFDPEKDLTDEQWKAIYGSGRFKQLNERAKEADRLKSEREAAERKQLEEQGKWKELADKNASTAEQYKNAAVGAKIEAVAARLGSVDPEAVAALINRSGISIDDSLNVSGVEDAVNALKASKPYLFNNSNNQTTRVGSPTNPGGTNTGYKFKMSEIRNPKFYSEHSAEIKDAIRNGQVDKDN